MTKKYQLAVLMSNQITRTKNYMKRKLHHAILPLGHLSSLVNLDQFDLGAVGVGADEGDRVGAG